MSSTALSEIRPGLLLGSLTTLRLLYQSRITHVLSVMKGAPAVGDMHMGDACHQMSIPVDDEEHEDLLSWFEPGTAFITAAIAAGGRVLVHCVAGVSRSPTMVAAYLMATEYLDVDTAVSSIAALRSIVQPNEGFLVQLRVWQEMGCRMDESHPYARQKALEALSEQTLTGDTVQKRALAVPSDGGSSQDLLYRCRKCRNLIATSSNVASSYTVKLPNGGRPQFSGKRMSKDTGTNGIDETQLFVEPMQWMDEVVDGQVQGKLYCPGCHGRLGSFNWAGMQSSKGAWITPAFELQLSRLDAMSPQKDMTRIRQPALT